MQTFAGLGQNTHTFHGPYVNLMLMLMLRLSRRRKPVVSQMSILLTHCRLAF